VKRGFFLPVLLHLAVLAAVCATLSACFLRPSAEERCNRPQEYQKSDSIAAIKVPAGLDAPDPSQSLQIPEAGAQGYPDGRPCLEMPPDYFGRPVD
jgi:uncharacterized lipoprotein